MELKIALAPEVENLSRLKKVKAKERRAKDGARQAKERAGRANTSMERDLEVVAYRRWMVRGIVTRSGKHGCSRNSIRQLLTLISNNNSSNHHSKRQ